MLLLTIRAYLVPTRSYYYFYLYTGSLRDR